MLKKILSDSDCAKCRVCCVFDRSDVWEIPVFTKEIKDKLTDILGDDAKILEREGGYVMAMHFEEGEELAYCPALGKDGCRLGDAKPFDCRVWPFRVMRLKDGPLVITVSPVCETVSALPLSTLTEFLLTDNNGESLADKMFSYAKENPFAVKPYIDSYPILAVK